MNQSGGTVNFLTLGIAVTKASTYNLSGGQLNSTGTSTSFLISRSFPAILNVSGTGLASSKGNIVIAGGSDTTDNGTLNVSGGTVLSGPGATGTPGVTSANLTALTLLVPQSATTFTAAAGAVLNISGGTVAAKGLQFGSSVGVYATHNPPCQFIMTGGLLYLDSSGIALGSGVSGFSPQLYLGGGTIAATASWTDSMSTQLTGTNGNVTLQAADVNGTPFNITISGALTTVGTFNGGLNKTGAGNLTLSGGATYTGTTTVNTGQLTVDTTASTSIGPVSTSSGTTLSTVLSAAGQSWVNTGLSVSSSATVDFNFGSFQLSPSVSVIQVNGNLTLDSSDSCTIEGSSLVVGTFPLLTFTGTLTLTGGSSLPAITSLPNGVTAALVQSGNTINLQVTGSPNTTILNWGSSAAGPWDFGTPDWINASSQSAVDYTDGTAVNLNDNTQSAVVITLGTTVNPASVTANNTTAGTTSYTISGSDGITGGTSVVVQGTGTLALATPNTYTGGTTVNSGTLAINYGGDGGSDSAIGTGPLTLNTGATIDNTSGANLTLLDNSIQENWNGNFTYAGSQANLDLGSGPATLGSSSVQVTVLANMLTYDGVITDSGSHRALAVVGPGTLTLTGQNTYTGGTILYSGKLNINNGGDGGADSAIGKGTFTINAGTIDNTSGNPVQLQTAIAEAWDASFIFAGSGNLDLGS